MGYVMEAGRDLAAGLTAAGIPATVDPSEALGLAPCVLVGPPIQESRMYGGRVVTWRLVLLASTADPAQAWDQLDDLLDQLSTQLSWTRAEPSSAILPSGTDATPAYDVTYTATVTED